MNNFNFQDTFLNNLRKEKISVTIFLFNGYKLNGIVKGFDNYVILLESDKGQQLVYKHSISSIIPIGNVKIINSDAEME